MFLYLFSLFLLLMSDAAPERTVMSSWLLHVQADTQESGHAASEARSGKLRDGKLRDEELLVGNVTSGRVDENSSGGGDAVGDGNKGGEEW